MNSEEISFENTVIFLLSSFAYHQKFWSYYQISIKAFLEEVFLVEGLRDKQMQKECRIRRWAI